MPPTLTEQQIDKLDDIFDNDKASALCRMLKSGLFRTFCWQQGTYRGLPLFTGKRFLFFPLIPNILRKRLDSLPAFVYHARV